MTICTITVLSQDHNDYPFAKNVKNFQLNMIFARTLIQKITEDAQYRRNFKEFESENLEVLSLGR